MAKHLRFYISLLILLSAMIPTATVWAQENPQETFLPSVYGKPAPPEPSPYNLNMRNVVIYPTDLGNNDYDLREDEPLEFTNEGRQRGAINGYTTYMVTDEERVDKGPFALGSYAILFMTEAQAKTYFDAVQQSLVNSGLEGYWRFESRVIYVEREYIQGYTVLHAYSLGREGNVVYYIYSVDVEGIGRDPSTYTEIMRNKFINGSASSVGQLADDGPIADMPIDLPPLPQTFEVIAP